MGPVQAPPLNHDDLVGYLKSMMARSLETKFESDRGIDFAYHYGEKARYRVNAYYERSRMKIVMRSISTTVPTLEQLELPGTLKNLAMLNRGMVLVTGATGSGKSTTMAGMMEFINQNVSRCVVTIEDPIEFLYENDKCIITQREVGVDVVDFNSGLIQALRQDPDVILIGEMRDIEAMRVSVTAAETGHLLFSTLHTTNAVQTVERIIGTFPEEERDMIREQLAFNLKGAIAQRLVRRAGNRGRIAGMEILIVNTTIEKLIYENRIRDIAGIITSREDGMRTFDQSLSDLVRAEKIDMKEAERHCDDVFAVRRFVRGIKSTGEGGGIIAGFS